MTEWAAGKSVSGLPTRNEATSGSRVVWLMKWSDEMGVEEDGLEGDEAENADDSSMGVRLCC